MQCTDKSTGMAIGSLSTQTGQVKYSVPIIIVLYEFILQMHQDSHDRYGFFGLTRFYRN